MSNEKNLIPAKKGDIRNPNKGRGKGTRNRATLAAYWMRRATEITDPLTDKVKKGTVEDAHFLTLEKLANDPKVKPNDRITAIKEMFDMLYGKAAQPFKDESDKADEIALQFPTKAQIEKAGYSKK